MHLTTFLVILHLSFNHSLSVLIPSKKNILKNTKNIENYTKQPIAQIKKNMLGIVKSVQKRKRNISKLYIDTVGLSCYTRTIEQPIAQKRSPEIKYI